MSNCFWTTLVDVNTNCSYQSGWVFDGSMFYELPDYDFPPPTGAPPGPTLTADVLLGFNPTSTVKTDDGRTHAVMATHQESSGIPGNIFPTYLIYYYSDDDGVSWTLGDDAALLDPPMLQPMIYGEQSVEPVALITDGETVYMIQAATEINPSMGTFLGESLVTWTLSGGSWTKQQADDVDMSLVDAAIAPNGDFYALGWDVNWGSDRAYVAVSSDQGASWTRYALDSGWGPTGAILSRSIVFDASGNAHIVVVGQDGSGTQSVLYYRPTSATTWASAFEILSGSETPGSGNPNLAGRLLIDSSGTLYALYMIDYFIGDMARGIYFAKSTDNGVTWDLGGTEGYSPLKGQIVNPTSGGNADDLYGLDGLNGFHAVITDTDEIHVIVELGIGADRGVYWLVSDDGETYSAPFPLQYNTGTHASEADPDYEAYSEFLGEYHDDHPNGGYYGLPWNVSISNDVIHVLFNRVPDFDVTYNTYIGTVAVADDPPTINYIKYVVP